MAQPDGSGHGLAEAFLEIKHYLHLAVKVPPSTSALATRPLSSFSFSWAPRRTSCPSSTSLIWGVRSWSGTIGCSPGSTTLPSPSSRAGAMTVGDLSSSLLSAIEQMCSVDAGGPRGALPNAHETAAVTQRPPPPPASTVPLRSNPLTLSLASDWECAVLHVDE